MISQIDESVQRLRSYFKRVDVGAAASSEQIADLQRLFAYVPEDVEYFYTSFNGIRVEIDDSEDGEIWNLGFSLSQVPLPSYYDHPEQYLPIRNDGCGNEHCMILRNGYGAGSVVFLDHEAGEGPAYLLAGSMGGYLKMWADYLIFRHSSDGKKYPECDPVELDHWPWLARPVKDHPWPFDLNWMMDNDSSASLLINDDRFSTWIPPQP